MRMRLVGGVGSVWLRRIRLKIHFTVDVVALEAPTIRLRVSWVAMDETRGAVARIRTPMIARPIYARIWIATRRTKVICPMVREEDMIMTGMEAGRGEDLSRRENECVLEEVIMVG